MQVLLILQILLVIGLVATILVQKSSSDGFTGASSPSAFMSGRAQANLFTRVTSIFAALFLINSLVLAYMASHTERGVSILDKLTGKNTVKEQIKTEAPSKKIAKTTETDEISDEKNDLKQEVQDNLQNETEDQNENEPTPKIKAEEKEKAPSVPISE